jgi:hypothetical protein
LGLNPDMSCICSPCFGTCPYSSLTSSTIFAGLPGSRHTKKCEKPARNVDHVPDRSFPIVFPRFLSTLQTFTPGCPYPHLPITKALPHPRNIVHASSSVQYRASIIPMPCARLRFNDQRWIWAIWAIWLCLKKWKSHGSLKNHEQIQCFAFARSLLSPSGDFGRGSHVLYCSLPNGPWIELWVKTTHFWTR